MARQERKQQQNEILGVGQQASSEQMPGKISRLISRRDGVRDTHFGSRPGGIRKGAVSLPQMPTRGAKRWICIRTSAGSR